MALKDWKKYNGEKTEIRVGPFFEKKYGSNFHGDPDYLTIKYFNKQYYFDVEHYPYIVFYTSAAYKTKSEALKYAKEYMKKH